MTKNIDKHIFIHVTPLSEQVFSQWQSSPKFYACQIRLQVPKQDEVGKVASNRAQNAFISFSTYP